MEKKYLNDSGLMQFWGKIKSHTNSVSESLQSQIDDKQQQITDNDEEISLLQTRSTQMEETIKSIAATGGASQATSVTYDNANSQLTAVNIQSAVDELQGSKIDKTSILQESGEAEDKVMSQKAVSDKLSDLSNEIKSTKYVIAGRDLRLTLGNLYRDNNLYLRIISNNEATDKVQIFLKKTNGTDILKLTLIDKKLYNLILDDTYESIYFYNKIGENGYTIELSINGLLDKRLTDIEKAVDKNNSTITEVNEKVSYSNYSTDKNDIRILSNNLIDGSCLFIRLYSNQVTEDNLSVYLIKPGASDIKVLTITDKKWHRIDITETFDSVYVYNNRGNGFSLDISVNGNLDNRLRPAERVSVDYYNSIDTFVYFQQNQKPSIKKKNDKINVIFPNSAFYIVKRDGGKVMDATTVASGKTYTLQDYNKLVYDKSDNQVKVVDWDTNGDYYLLLSNIHGYYLSGLLMNYFYFDKFEENDKQLYFIGRNLPEIYSNENKSIFVKIPTQGYRIYAKNGEILLETNRNVNTTFEVTDFSKLVYDIDDDSLKVVPIDTKGNYYLFISNVDGYATGLLMSYYYQYNNSMMFLYGNGKHDIIFQNLKKKNIGHGDDAGYTPLVLLHFSDIHGSSDNLTRILQYKKMYDSRIDDIISTGDNVYDEFKNGYDFWNNYIDLGSKKIITAIGNHDVLDRDAGGDTHVFKDVYDLEIAPYVANWGVIQPDNAADKGLCYFYKDYPASNVRLIVLDSMTMVHLSWNYVTENQAQEQYDWFVESLGTAGNRTVVVATHFPAVTDFNTSSNFCSLDAINPSDTIPNKYYDAVDNFINNNGKFACWISGHTHEDALGFVTNHQNQVSIIINTARCLDDASATARKNGTPSQDLFNIFSVDVNTSTIKIVRIGANMDRYMREINHMCYNYKSKKLIK